MQPIITIGQCDLFLKLENSSNSYKRKIKPFARLSKLCINLRHDSIEMIEKYPNRSYNPLNVSPFLEFDFEPHQYDCRIMLFLFLCCCLMLCCFCWLYCFVVNTSSNLILYFWCLNKTRKPFVFASRHYSSKPCLMSAFQNNVTPFCFRRFFLNTHPESHHS